MCINHSLSTQSLRDISIHYLLYCNYICFSQYKLVLAHVVSYVVLKTVGDFIIPSTQLSTYTGQPILLHIISHCSSIGSYLPNLSQLRITSGVIPCVRDLGTSLTHVTVLWMPRCKLKDLDGLPALSSLKELYLSFNEITDVCLVTMLPSLEVLDIER